VKDETRYGTATLVHELRMARAAAQDERALLVRVTTLARRAAAHRHEWLRPEMCVPDDEQGFGICVLHEEANHDLAVFVASWLPNRGTPPHDHGTWAVVVGLEGAERNTFWRRLDDGGRPGRAEIVKVRESVFGPGDVVAMPAGAIHSVWNDGNRVAASLHIYGRHVNHTQRSRFDPATGTELPYLLATSAVPGSTSGAAALGGRA
jgi:predicted metal-dependent enzyme (double-stranded beta helix superfamily)